MRKKWFWPIVIISLIAFLLLVVGLYMAYKAYQRTTVLEVDERIKNHVVIIDGTVKQNLGFYYLKTQLKEPAMMHVKLGDTVQKGDPLYTYVDDSLTESEKEIELKLDNRRINKQQIEGQIAAYQARLTTASPESTETIESQINWLESELAKAENNIAILEAQQNKTAKKVAGLTVTAGADGVVMDVDDEQLQAFTSPKQNKPVLTVSFNDLHIEGLASRYQVQFLEPGLKIKATTPEVKNAIFEGQIETFQNTREDLLKRGIIIEDAPTTELPTTESPEEDTDIGEFPYTALLDKTSALYDGDAVKVKVQLSYKNHVWLPEKFVQKQVIKKNKKGKILPTPQTNYYVMKRYGNGSEKEKVSVAKRIGGQYLVTEGLSSIDTLEAIKK